MGSGLPSINFEFRNDDNKRSRMNYYLFYTVSYPLKYCTGIHVFSVKMVYFLEKFLLYIENNSDIVLLCCFLSYPIVYAFVYSEESCSMSHTVWLHRFHITFTTFTHILAIFCWNYMNDGISFDLDILSLSLTSMFIF